MLLYLNHTDYKKSFLKIVISKKEYIYHDYYSENGLNNMLVMLIDLCKGNV